MCQEAEKRISFGFLKGVVDNAIKNRDFSFIETTDDENQLIYMQKYIDLENTKRNVVGSFYSLRVGTIGLCMSIVAIGLAFILIAVASVPKSVNILVDIIGGIAIIIMGMYFAIRTNKEFEVNEKDADFRHDIILRIEEQLIRIREKKLPKE